MRAGAGERKLEFEVKFRLLSDGDYMNKLTLKRCTTLFSPDSIIKNKKEKKRYCKR